MKICSVDGCEKPYAKGGYCNAHYIRMRRYGRIDRERNDWSNATPEEIAKRDKAWKRKEYEKNRDSYIERSRKWQSENPDSYSKRKETYFSREDVQEKSRERTREWAKRNPTRKREQDRKFAEENPGLITSYKAMRRARVRRAVPAWLTQEERDKIAALYDECRAISESTGIPHQVDHIIPLAGKYVSGLHVLANLRIITAEENNRRKRIWNPLKDHS